eukprot:CAMPEP_0202958452 /NCGR_PEP_ID=MMETSP1396-20130829/2794_1 /ASSEMBLY_ACC=CAM_ASM_000872 /TAXON_ID= /ORGANISM="Pseudokeronopsis sp., Strain Brazil" /LENGTH=133 /DNA_ID=CAMNT_0049676535 /DNA_START=652 /DNA_END=1053 /DNA_ORIENTATION=+
MIKEEASSLEVSLAAKGPSHEEEVPPEEEKKQDQVQESVEEERESSGLGGPQQVQNEFENFYFEGSVPDNQNQEMSQEEELKDSDPLPILEPSGQQEQLRNSGENSPSSESSRGQWLNSRDNHPANARIMEYF